jgi:hypothetical protein
MINDAWDKEATALLSATVGLVFAGCVAIGRW